MKRHPASRSKDPAPAAEAQAARLSRSIRPSLRLLGLLLAALPWCVWPSGLWLDPLTDPKWLVGCAGMVACLLLIVREERAGSEFALAACNSRPGPFAAGAGLIVAGLLLSAAASPVRGLGLLTALREGFYPMFALVLALRPPARRELRWVLGCLLVSMSFEALLALGQYFVPDWTSAIAFKADLPPGRASMIGTIGNPEYLAGWLAMGLAASVALALGRGAPERRGRDPLALLAAVAGALSLLMIFVSGGRGAALAVAVALAALGAVMLLAGRFQPAPARADTQDSELSGQRSARGSLFPIVPIALLRKPTANFLRRGWILAIAGVAVLILIVFSAVQNPQARNGSLPDRLRNLADFYTPSMRHRIGLLAVTSQMIRERPLLGAGPGLYGHGFALTQGRLAAAEPGIGFWALGDVLAEVIVNEAHCDPLQWWAEYGLLPFAGLLLMLSAALTGAWKNFGPCASPNERYRRTLTAALWAAVAAMGVDMWVAFPLHLPVRALTFWSLLGLLAGVGRSCQERH
jgi:hypothetical protein